MNSLLSTNKSDKIWSFSHGQGCSTIISESPDYLIIRGQNREGYSFCQFISENWLPNISESIRINIPHDNPNIPKQLSTNDPCQNFSYDIQFITQNRDRNSTPSTAKGFYIQPNFYQQGKIKTNWDNTCWLFHEHHALREINENRKSLTSEPLSNIDNSLIKMERFNQIDDLKTIYRFVNPDKIYRYLMDNYSYLDLIEAAAPIIKRYFNENEVLTLQFIEDPEDNYSQSLKVKVFSNLDIKDALKFLNMFMREWYFVNFEPYRYNLSFDVGRL